MIKNLRRSGVMSILQKLRRPLRQRKKKARGGEGGGNG
jgi:hypothetical protein